MLFLLGLVDDYQHDGRVILEVLNPNVLPSSLHARSDALLRLGRSTSRTNAPFGQLAASTLTVSTYAIEGDSPRDATYSNLENQIALWTARRDNLTE